MHFFYINILSLDAFYMFQNRGFIFRKMFVVVEHFWYICLLGRAIAGLNYKWFIAIHYKLKLPTYIQELLVIGRRGLPMERFK